MNSLNCLYNCNACTSTAIHYVRDTEFGVTIPMCKKHAKAYLKKIEHSQLMAKISDKGTIQTYNKCRLFEEWYCELIVKIRVFVRHLSFEYQGQFTDDQYNDERTATGLRPIHDGMIYDFIKKQGWKHHVMKQKPSYWKRDCVKEEKQLCECHEKEL